MAPLLAALLALTASALEIKPHALISEKRVRLTREYCKRHYGMDTAELKEPKLVVIHATEISTLDGSFDAFDRPVLGDARPELGAPGEVNVGVHFLVDRDGTIYSLLPLDMIGRHAIGLNHVALGIENVGFADKLTPAQLESDAALVKDLTKKRPSLRYLCGHHEYVDKKRAHYSLFKEDDPSYKPTKKSDPGPKFMAGLRKRLKRDGVELAD